ncbi:RDD family protein [Glycomyces buryatensis]|uniref:RDD family protein n=1 Tax=Glycomyces buryatensis TaxID=2570927 RepID=A0A4S8PVT5_9ACTN|nr:RDD family protein [Glycomyces buryatensis]THV33932.1 RDD family protein [Glycomyces buryatensis]
MTMIEPGWYKDPADPATQRYWDGSAWVGKPVPATAEPPERPEPLDPEPEPPAAKPSAPERGDQTSLYAKGFGDDDPPKLVQRTPGAVQPPDSIPIRSLGVTVGWISRRDIARILSGRTLAHPGQRFVARLVDFLLILALNAVINGYFIYQMVRDAWPHIRDYMEAYTADPDSGAQLEMPASVSEQWWIVLLIALGLWFAYEVPSTRDTGQTLGKRLMGIKVVSLAPKIELGWGRLILRWSYAALPLICFPFGAILWFLDAIWCIRDRPFRQCLHDKSPGTAVVEVTREKEPTA